jgi:hypothetical protein
MRLLALVLPLAAILAGCSHEPTVQEAEVQTPTAPEPAVREEKDMGSAALAGLWAETPYGPLVQSAAEAAEFPQATLACKVRMGAITKSEGNSHAGMKCDATCEVISTLKGAVGKTVQITFRQFGNGFTGLNGVKAGEVYIVMLQGEGPPYQALAAMRAMEAVVEPTLGTKPGDRLLAEMVAMCKSNEAPMRLAALRQIGLMRDTRASEVVNAAAKSADAETARAGVIAQYRMKITPEAKRVMELFNEQVMDVWNEESGDPQKGPDGKAIWRREGGHMFLERGLPDFDFATYVREGIKKDWVRKDDNTLHVFFGVPWKVQRKACVPELMKLLDDPDKRVRWQAVLCLTHTVENEDGPRGEQYSDGYELPKWRTWWKEKGSAYMAEPTASQPG